MKGTGFTRTVIRAFVLSVGGATLHALAVPALGAESAFRVVVPTVGLAYVVAVISSSRVQYGKAIAITVWTVCAGAAWMAQPTMGLLVAAHVTILWLARSLFRAHTGFGVLLDAGLCALAVAAAFWAAVETGSLFLSLWCFFLTLSMDTAMPLAWTGSVRNADSAERFERAHQSASAALRRLSVRSQSWR